MTQCPTLADRHTHGRDACFVYVFLCVLISREEREEKEVGLLAGSKTVDDKEEASLVMENARLDSLSVHALSEC